MSTTVRAPIGRDEELGAIARLLDDPAQLPAAVVLWGDAGIGKTSIWLAGLEAAAERGYRTLSSRPSEAEARLSYAGLADLLGAVAGVVLPELPPIQQRALEGALLLGASEAPSTSAPSARPSSRRCGCSPRAVRSASPSTTSSGSTRRRSRRCSSR